MTSGSTNLLTGIGYTPLGAIAGWTFGSGQAVARTFDGAGRVASVTMPWGARVYSYDSEDRITAISDGALGSATYGYDGFDRLTSATTALGAWTYGYDANGNRTSNSVNGLGYGVAVDGSSNRVNGYINQAGYARVVDYTPDGHAAQVGSGTPQPSCGSSVTFGYQADGQLATSNVLTAIHAPNGLRLQKTAAACAGGAKTNFIYDLAGHLIGEYDATGAPIQETAWLGDLPVAVFKALGGVVSNFNVYADNLGTPRVITSTSGQVVWGWDGEPFGATPANQNPNNLGDFAYGLRFPGQYFDVETGYHHNGWREYEPALGRYVQSDRIGLRGGLNTYLYVEANPLSYFDPNGTDRWGAETAPAVVLTFMAEGKTLFYDPFSQKLFEFATKNDVDRRSEAGAAGPYSGEVTYCETGKLAKAYGTAKMRTTDPRSRWVHGGGSSLADPWAPSQGWTPTMGCTRGQNEDVETLCSVIADFRAQGRTRTILYRRD
jgi:RHS repeat-associated protein